MMQVGVPGVVWAKQDDGDVARAGQRRADGRDSEEELGGARDRGLCRSRGVSEVTPRLEERVGLRAS